MTQMYRANSLVRNIKIIGKLAKRAFDFKNFFHIKIIAVELFLFEKNFLVEISQLAGNGKHFQPSNYSEDLNFISWE